MSRIPRRCRKMVMEYSVLYGRRSSGKRFHERSEAGFNVCLTLLQGAARVYGFYREQHGCVSSVQNHMMSELESMYHEVLHAGGTVVWIAKPLFSCVNNFLYIIYEYFLGIGMFEIACDVQLVYFTEFYDSKF